MTRNDEIIAMYQTGALIADISKRFHLSKARIYQILKGVKRQRKVRDLFLGVNISGPVKDALMVEADRRGVSMSSLSAQSLREMLITCGYPLEAEKV